MYITCPIFFVVGFLLLCDVILFENCKLIMFYSHISELWKSQHRYSYIPSSASSRSQRSTYVATEEHVHDDGCGHAHN